MSAIDPFYLIVDSAQIAQRLIPLGVKTVQLRIKNAPEPEVRAQLREVLTLCKQHNTQLILNDFWQMALEEGCNYIHLGQEDLDTADITAIRKAGIRIGISTHDEPELERALTFAPDYIALGPIYLTALKSMKWAPQGLARITQWKQRIGTIPLVVIGGLTIERLQGVFDAGANSAAVVTDILTNAHPEAQTLAWRKAITELNIKM